MFLLSNNTCIIYFMQVFLSLRERREFSAVLYYIYICYYYYILLYQQYINYEIKSLRKWLWIVQQASRKEEGDRQRHMLMLQDSLLKLGDYRQCVFRAEEAIHEALQCYMTSEEGEVKCAWSTTIVDLLEWLEK